jgi:hypothetical protein
MNPSEEVTELMQMTIPLENYCFGYADENNTVQVATRNTEPIDLVGAFVSYMKAVGFSVEDIEIALANQADLMRSFRLPFRCKTEINALDPKD